MHHLTSFSLLLTSLSLTTCTTSPNASASALAAATTTYPPPSAASLAALNLPGGNANPALTLYVYGDPECTDINSTYSTLVNAQSLSYNQPSPQYPFWGFQMTRNLTGSEKLSFYSTSNASTDACGEFLDAWNATDGGAGYCWPSGGATCYNLTQS